MRLWALGCLLSLLVCQQVEYSQQAETDYYKILGIDHNANPQQIKKAFRKQAAKYHPDKNKDPGAEEQFKKVNEAHDTLMDADKRKQYDQFGHAGSSGPHSSSGHEGYTFHFDPNDDIFRNIFEQGVPSDEMFNFNQKNFHGRHPYDNYQAQQKLFSFNIFDDDEPEYVRMDPHTFGGGDTFFGSHMNSPYGHYRPVEPKEAKYKSGRSPTGWDTKCYSYTLHEDDTLTTVTRCS